MTIMLWVERADGTLVQKSADQIADYEKVVFDAPGAFAEADEAQGRLDAEIESAGGVEKWRATLQERSA